MKPLDVHISDGVVRLDLYDDLSALPSNNKKDIGYRRTRRGMKPFVKHTSATRTYFGELTVRFKTLTNLIQPLTWFGADPVHILIICGERYDKRGHRIGRWDAHNMGKFVVDWLQEVGVINDDSNAEVQMVKRREYYGNRDAHTSIIIQQKKKVQEELERFVKGIDEHTRRAKTAS
jgi:hypothetical protein